jgi:hypothetical protein
MLRYHGGQEVDKGTYWNVRTGERVAVEGTAALPGGGNDTFVRVSSVVVLLFGPVLGLVFAIFLPFIGIAMTITLVAGKIAALLTQAAGKGMSFGWRPSVSYLGGRRRVKKRPEESSPKDGVPR